MEKIRKSVVRLLGARRSKYFAGHFPCGNRIAFLYFRDHAIWPRLKAFPISLDNIMPEWPQVACTAHRRADPHGLGHATRSNASFCSLAWIVTGTALRAGAAGPAAPDHSRS